MKTKILISFMASAFLVGCGGGSSSNQSNHTDKLINVYDYPTSVLTDEQKYSLAYMWNEEKLAKDIYLELNKLYPTRQLENISTRSETQHEAMVEALVEKYDINITNLDDYTVEYSEAELRALGAGQFAIPAIQDLYDALYSKGSQSPQDTLEVGCMVEVTDIDDLDKFIITAQENNATDLVAVFDNLKSGSYNHYWAFDLALKNSGVTTGCCSLGTIDGVNYCQPDYPSK
jgi:hypothetical protein